MKAVQSYILRILSIVVVGVILASISGCQPSLTDLYNLARLFGFHIPTAEDIPEIPNFVRISEDFGDGSIVDSNPLLWVTQGGTFEVVPEDETPFPLSSGAGLEIQGDENASSSTQPVSLGAVKIAPEAPFLKIDDFLFLLATVDFKFVGNPNNPDDTIPNEGVYRFAIGFDLTQTVDTVGTATFSGLAVVVDGVTNTFRVGRTADIHRVFESDGLEVLDEANAGDFDEIKTIIEDPSESELRREIGLPAHLYRIEANRNPVLVQFFYDEVSVFRLDESDLGANGVKGGTMVFVAGPQSTVFLDDVNISGADFIKPKIPGINA